MKNRIKELRKYILENYTDETLPVLSKGEGISCYTTRFYHGEKLAGFRNPFNAPNNMCYYENFISDKMNRYFTFTSNIMAVNCINTDVQDRNNGEDFDSDFNLVTNNTVIVEGAKKSLEYPTIVNAINKSKKKMKMIREFKKNFKRNYWMLIPTGMFPIVK